MYRKTKARSDCPFIEAKEGIGGYDIITAENLEQALAPWFYLALPSWTSGQETDEFTKEH